MRSVWKGKKKENGFVKKLFGRLSHTKDGKDSFFESSLIQDGIIRNLEVIGEAVNRPDPTFRSSYPDIDWRGIISLRNLLIHQYHRVDLNLLWRVIQQDIPELKEQIQEICGEKTA